MNSLPKYVASSTLAEAEWNATLLKGDVAGEVTRLKQQAGRDLLVYGSADLVRTLHRHALIDLYRLWVHPVVVGSGKRLFGGDSTPATFALADTTRFGSGVIVLSYKPGNAV
jgi:dihydrofolate reductase